MNEIALVRRSAFGGGFGSAARLARHSGRNRPEINSTHFRRRTLRVAASKKPALLAQSEALGHVGVAACVDPDEIVEETTALTDEHQEAAARTEILRVGLQMLGQVIDPTGEQSDLHIRRARVLLVPGEFFDALRLRNSLHTV